MSLGTKAKAVGTVAASCALVLGLATSAMATTKVYANSYGYGEWNSDPSGSIPGDAMRACDNNSDGYGVTAKLIYNFDIIRTATTSGHNAGYCSAWKSGDLPEGRKYMLQVFRVKDGVEIDINWAWVTA
jgi:hypothetical protein